MYLKTRRWVGVQIVWEGELRREDIVAQIKEDAGLLPDDMFYLVDAVRPPPLVLCTPTTTHARGGMQRMCGSVPGGVALLAITLCSTLVMLEGKESNPL